MEVLRPLKELYSGKNAISNHITLFSILGIVVILLNNVVAAWGASAFYFDFFAIAPSSRFELWLTLTVCILLMIYLFGYDCKFLYSKFQNNDSVLPEMDLVPMSMFFKSFPVFVLWQMYYAVLFVIGVLFLPTNNSTMVYLAASLLVCSIPFMNLIFVKFISDFKYSKDVLLPSSIFKYIDKCFLSLIGLILGILLLAILPCGLVLWVSKFAHKIVSEPLKLSVYLASICVFIYFITILKFVYLDGLVKIVKSKILNQE